MPYVRQTSHIDRVRDLIAGRIVNPGADMARLASSYRRSLDDYRLDPASTTGPRILTGAELRAIQQSEENFLRSTGQCLPRLHAMVRDRETGYSPQFRADMPSAAPLPIYPPSYYGNSVAKTGIKTQSGSKRYFCGQNKQCSNIKTCDEARYLLKHCGLRRLDRDGDGVPCESLCSGGQ